MQGGKLRLASTAGLESVSGNGTHRIVLTGTLPSINQALNGLVFKPRRNVPGVLRLRMTTDDLGNTGAGGAAIDRDEFLVMIWPVR